MFRNILFIVVRKILIQKLKFADRKENDRKTVRLGQLGNSDFYCILTKQPIFFILLISCLLFGENSKFVFLNSFPIPALLETNLFKDRLKMTESEVKQYLVFQHFFLFVAFKLTHYLTTEFCNNQVVRYEITIRSKIKKVLKSYSNKIMRSFKHRTFFPLEAKKNLSI